MLGLDFLALFWLKCTSQPYQALARHKGDNFSFGKKGTLDRPELRNMSINGEKNLPSVLIPKP